MLWVQLEVSLPRYLQLSLSFSLSSPPYPSCKWEFDFSLHWIPFLEIDEVSMQGPGGLMLSLGNKWKRVGVFACTPTGRECCSNVFYVSFLVLAKCRFALGNQSVAFLIFTNACVLQGHLCSVFMLEMNIHRFFFVFVFADIIHLTFLTLWGLFYSSIWNVFTSLNLPDELFFHEMSFYPMICQPV